MRVQDLRLRPIADASRVADSTATPSTPRTDARGKWREGPGNACMDAGRSEHERRLLRVGRRLSRVAGALCRAQCTAAVHCAQHCVVRSAQQHCAVHSSAQHLCSTAQLASALVDSRGTHHHRRRTAADLGLFLLLFGFSRLAPRLRPHRHPCRQRHVAGVQGLRGGLGVARRDQVRKVFVRQLALHAVLHRELPQTTRTPPALRPQA
eukprot:3770873-Rhodomonas_salina.1